jgi:predicted  nucleic acid-binding Zn-ribbon protein
MLVLLQSQLTAEDILPMKEQLLALYELQGLDLEISQARNKLAAISGAKELKLKLAAGKSKLETAEKTLQALETELKDSELQLKTIEEKRAGYEKRLYNGAIVNPKELSAIEKEIQMLKEQQSKLDSHALELYDKVETARNKVQSLRKIVAEIERRIEGALSKESSDKADLESKLADLQSKREEAALKITNKSLMARYDAVRKKTGTTGISKVIDGKCEGCRISIAAFMMRKLSDYDEIVTCESCGRILFIDSK